VSAWDPRKLVADEHTSRTFVLAALVVYVAATAFVAIHHEPWRDEADPWLYVRDADFFTMLARTRYAGFPALWFLILAPLAKLGFPYFSQTVLHLMISTAAVAVLLARAPLSRLAKVLILPSYFLAYEYAVIVRSYALSVLLMFIAVDMHVRRRARPLTYAVVLFLLANVNAQGFVVAGTLAALFTLEQIQAGTLRGRALAATALMAAGGLVSWLQVRTPPDGARHVAHHLFRPDVFQSAVSGAFFPLIPEVIGFVGGMLLLLLITIALRASREALFVLWLALAGLAGIYVVIWYGGLRHAGFLLVLTILAIWIGAAAPIDRSFATAAAILLNAALFAGALAGLRYWILDTRESFSGAQEMAEFIRARHLDRYEIAAHNLTQCEALLPYLPGKRFWYAGLGTYGTYMMWDAAFERALDVPYPVAERRAQDHFDGRQWLLLFNVEMPDPPRHGFRLLYTNQRPIFEKTDERYWLYEPTHPQ
jgi:hypothetical protein